MISRRALVTGISGQDGSYLAEFLLEKGYQVFGLVRRSSSKPANLGRIAHILDKIVLIEGDLTDETSLNNAVREAEPDEVYNLGAQSFVSHSWKAPSYTADVTGLGVVRMLEAIRNYDTNIRFYQASSSEMYGNNAELPLNEESKFYPRSPYACAKAFAHYSTINYRESYGMHASCGICFNHEGPRRGEEFVTRKISQGVAKISLGLDDHINLGNLGARRDWGYAKDYIEAMWSMLQQKEPEDYVIATGESHSVKEFVKVAFEVIRIEDWLKYVSKDTKFMRPVDVPDLVGDYSKAKEKLGWKPKMKFEELVRLMVETDVAKILKES